MRLFVSSVEKEDTAHGRLILAGIAALFGSHVLTWSHRRWRNMMMGRVYADYVAVGRANPPLKLFIGQPAASTFLAAASNCDSMAGRIFSAQWTAPLEEELAWMSSIGEHFMVVTIVGYRQMLAANWEPLGSPIQNQITAEMGRLRRIVGFKRTNVRIST